MNSPVLNIGPITIHAFTAWMGLGIAIGFVLVIGGAAVRHEKRMSAFDCAIGALVGGVIGARAGHVWLNWAYFSAHGDQIADLSNGGLDWHGAVALGLLFALCVAAIRRVKFGSLADSLALALPVGAIAAWIACAAVPAAYGIEVPTLADYPSWLVIESPDIYGNVAPRINLPPIGIALAVVVLLIVVVLTLGNRLAGLRLWLALALYALGLGVIDMFRADYAPIWSGHRADQVLDLAVALLAILIFGLLALARLTRSRSVVPRVAAEGVIA